MFDVVIRGGRVVDGTGKPARNADVGIRDGRIAAIGTIAERGATEIDASGRVVSPGFIDVHTHYDAQAFWDPTLSPSCYHGVTTVVAGNCGFTIAPLSGDPQDAEYLMRMLARVEGMPLESLRSGVPWNWRSFEEFLDKLDGKLALNAGFMVGHSALRRCVMGRRAVGHSATPEEIAAMQELLRESIAAGGLGFSSTVSMTHNDGDGNPVPSRHASDEELFALASVVSEFPGTHLEFLPGIGAFTDAEKERIIQVALAGKRTVNWNLLNPDSKQPGTHLNQLALSDYAAARGAKIVALTVPQPITVRVNLITGFAFDALPGWGPIICQPLDERIRSFSDPAVRKTLDEGARSMSSGVFAMFVNWAAWTVDEVFTEQNRTLKGRNIGEIAAEQSKSPFDALLDIAVSEELKTSFMPPSFGDDEESWRMRGEVWTDPRTVVGASDAGAHLDMIDTFAFSTQLLAEGVRKRSLISLEEAVRQLTSVPAGMVGLCERGELREGYHADIVVFDPDTVGRGPIYTRFDLPGGAGRLYADAIGVRNVLVNGREIVRDGESTGALAGSILRSGRDTAGV